MSNGAAHIYIDSTFISVEEGYTEVLSEVEFVEVDGIGNFSIPTVYQTTAPLLASATNDIEYYICDVVNGTDIIPISFFRELFSDFGVVPFIMEYSSNNVVSGTQDNYISYFTGYNTISGTINEIITFIVGEHYTGFKSYLIEHNCGSVIIGSNSYWQNYMNYSGHVNTSGLPIPALDVQKNIITEYGTGVQSNGSLNPYVDISFAGWVDYPFLADVFAVDMGVSGTCLLDVQTISGCVTPVYLDTYSTLLVASGIDTDIYCSLLEMSDLLFEVETTNGHISYLTNDVYSTVVDLPGVTCDINLYPLKITNFSLDIEEYTTATNNISVDILDDVYGVSISGTYLKVENQVVPVTFSGIDNGYRMFYDPVDDFDTLNGPTVFTVHAENKNDDELEALFYLTFGYIVEYDNKYSINAGFDYNTKVTVRVTAENYDSCPKVTADGHRFITEHRKNVDLGATIVGMFRGEGVGDLSAKIYPESTAYFYGKEFTVVINVKDFANNIMEPVILRYKIEDRPV